jgi:ClpP class serine protease
LKKDYIYAGVEEDSEKQARFKATMTSLLAKDTENLVSTLKSYRNSNKAAQPIDKAAKGDIFTAKEAVSSGLIDELGSYHKILKRDFPDSRLHIVRTGLNSVVFHRAIKLSNYFGVRLVFYIILIYKVLSYILKFMILKMMVPTDKSKKTPKLQK